MTDATDANVTAEDGAGPPHPFVTFVIPAFNAQDTVEFAIASVLCQEGAGFELIIVDDGSTDATPQAIERATSGKSDVTVITQANRGTAAALNRGGSVARGDYVVALGADDSLTSDFLERMAAFVAMHPGFDIYSHDMWNVNADGTRSRTLGWSESRSVSLDDLLVQCVIFGGGTMIRRTLLKDLGGYREDTFNEDYDFFLRALGAGASHMYVPEPLYLYSRSASQKTANRGPMYESAIAMFRDFLDTHDLTENQVHIVEETINGYSKMIDETRSHGGKTEGQLVEAYADDEIARLKAILHRILPGGAADRAYEGMRHLRWLARPVRRFIWRRRLRTARGPRHD